MKLNLRSLIAFFLVAALTAAPVTIFAQSGFLGTGDGPPSAVLEATGTNDEFDYSDYGYPPVDSYDTSSSDMTGGSSFLGPEDGSGPGLVLEATSSQNSARQLALTVTNFTLGFMGMVSAYELAFGVMTLNSDIIINGSTNLASTMVSYAFVPIILNASSGF